jgi:hypothetical protein
VYGLEAKIVGVMKFMKMMVRVDDKVVCVPADDRNTGDKNKLSG